MRDAAQLVLRIATRKDVEHLDPDSEIALALARLLEVPGEAARYVSGGTRSGHPEMPWQDIAATRHRIVHRYFDVDYAIVAAIIRDDVPPLLPQLDAIIAEIGTRPTPGPPPRLPCPANRVSVNALAHGLAKPVLGRAAVGVRTAGPSIPPGYLRVFTLRCAPCRATPRPSSSAP
ncbi:MAG: HepT-like ribonuclease domain-containing protein [Candidatus Latescibacterota bacterium]